jgi:hypothetical protein
VRFSVLILLVMALAGCQPVPRPFDDVRKSPNDLLKLSDTRGIMVLPVTDAPPNTARELAAQMAAALIKQNLPAFVSGASRSSMVLSSAVIDPGRDAVIGWTLVDPDGKEIGRHEQILEGTPVELWARADPELMTTLANIAAPSIAVMVQDEQVHEVFAPPVFVGDVRGTNPRDTIRLQSALRRALRGLGTRVATARSDKTLVATANVAITPLPKDQREVAIAWAVSDPFGTEVGKIEQASPFSRTAVEQKWGQLAREAGVAAAAGIKQLISQIDWSKGFLPPPSKREN